VKENNKRGNYADLSDDDLSFKMVEAIMNQIMSGNATSAQIM